MSTKTARKKKTNNLAELKVAIVDAILDIKGEEVISLNLSEVQDAVTDCFIVCHASSTTQVKAIADNVMEKVKESLNESPWHKEGFENLEWVLLDYVNIVVHVFHQEKRAFYQLEELWSDAEKEVHE